MLNTVRFSSHLQCCLPWNNAENHSCHPVNYELLMTTFDGRKFRLISNKYLATPPGSCWSGRVGARAEGDMRTWTGVNGNKLPVEAFLQCVVTGVDRCGSYRRCLSQENWCFFWCYASVAYWWAAMRPCRSRWNWTQQLSKWVPSVGRCCRQIKRVCFQPDSCRRMTITAQPQLSLHKPVTLVSRCALLRKTNVCDWLWSAQLVSVPRWTPALRIMYFSSDALARTTPPPIPLASGELCYVKGTHCPAVKSSECL